MSGSQVQLRRSGISVPLFSLRSTRSWGIGEIGDIAPFASWLRLAHQSVLQVLPLNELAPTETSPYSALSAMAFDPRYITVRDIEDAVDFEQLWSGEIQELRRSPRIDHERVIALKHRALRVCFDRFFTKEWLRGTARAAALQSFIRDQEWWLGEYSLYRALRAQAGEKPWTEWDPAVRDRQSDALRAVRDKWSREVLFFDYVQWIAAAQWRAAHQAAAGVQIFGDLPFMVTADSADVWSRQQEFILDASVGTPPDAFSETGQEWGLPPYNWYDARGNDFEWLRSRARRLADIYDGFRVDHLVGFYRTYVRPSNGATPYFMPQSEGAQLALGEELMAIVTSFGADVSVEDLGTVPDFVRESVARLGLSGYRVFRWEEKDPSEYPEISIAMTGTHDTEPLAAWWTTLSAEDRQQFAEMPTVAAAHPMGSEGLMSITFDGAIRDAILKAVLGAASRLVLLPIQDVFGSSDRINHPATVGDWNWTYVLPWPVDRLADEPDAVEAQQRLRSLTEAGGRTAGARQ
jgi:4-alpha-glucanotransferase